jgi:hypothetical protein
MAALSLYINSIFLRKSQGQGKLCLMGFFTQSSCANLRTRLSPEDECGLAVIPKESVFFGKGKESQ